MKWFADTDLGATKNELVDLLVNSDYLILCISLSRNLIVDPTLRQLRYSRYYIDVTMLYQQID